MNTEPKENLVEPTQENVAYWTQRIIDATEIHWCRKDIEKVIRELLTADTHYAASKSKPHAECQIFGGADAVRLDQPTQPVPLEPKPNIILTKAEPPIPVRSFDWSAYRDGYDEGDPIGWGATKEEAIAELLSREGEV